MRPAFNKLVLLTGALAASWLVAGLAGCSKQEEKAPAGDYTGPMNSKGTTSGADNAPPTAKTNNQAAPK